MYWLKLIALASLTFPIALVCERRAVEWLPSWLPVGYTLALTLPSLVALACAGRVAELVSNLLALESELLSEGASNLGPTRNRRALAGFTLCQIALILLGLLLHYSAQSGGFRLALVHITLIGYAATLSNVLLILMTYAIDAKARERRRLRMIAQPVPVGPRYEDLTDYRDTAQRSRMDTEDPSLTDDDLGTFDATRVITSEYIAPMLAVPMAGLFFILFRISFLFAAASMLALLVFYGTAAAYRRMQWSFDDVFTVLLTMSIAFPVLGLVSVILL